MGEHLFTAYNYLSSSIAQAFAALIGLTAVFYFNRRNALRNQIRERIEEIAGAIVFAEAESSDNRKVVKAQRERIEY
jgi:F0F1-type ATP synthase membrane subunit b/b'